MFKCVQHDGLADINSPPSQPQTFGGYHSTVMLGQGRCWLFICVVHDETSCNSSLSLPPAVCVSCVCDQPSPTSVYTLSNHTVGAPNQAGAKSFIG